MDEETVTVAETPAVPRAYPVWLFSKEQGAALVETPEQEALLTGTWYNSPAEYGVETHPSGNPLVSMPLQASAAAVSGDAGRLAGMQAHLDTMQVTMDDLRHRLQQLETQMTYFHSVQAPPATEEVETPPTETTETRHRRS